MNRVAVAQELVKLARELTSEDSPKELAVWVVTKMSRGMGLDDAFRAIDHGDLWTHTQPADRKLLDSFDSLSNNERMKALTKVIEKALNRQKKYKGWLQQSQQYDDDTIGQDL